MSVDRTDYVFYGWKIPFKIDDVDFWSDKFLPMIEGHPGEKFSIIRDGMCGEYTVFGVIICKSGEEGFDFCVIDKLLDNLPSHQDMVKKYIDIFGKEPCKPTETFVFSHYS